MLGWSVLPAVECCPLSLGPSGGSFCDLGYIFHRAGHTQHIGLKNSVLSNTDIGFAWIYILGKTILPNTSILPVTYTLYMVLNWITRHIPIYRYRNSEILRRGVKISKTFFGREGCRAVGVGDPNFVMLYAFYEKSINHHSKAETISKLKVHLQLLQNYFSIAKIYIL